MSFATLFTREPPFLGTLVFDARLEDTFEARVDWAEFPIETGANAIDHGIIRPRKWSLIGAVSKNPVRVDLTDFTGILTNIASNNAALAALAGVTAGMLSGPSDTRASAALIYLINIMVARIPFDVDCGDIVLTNMVISNLRRTKNPANEGGLIFEAELQELATLDTITGQSQPSQFQLRQTDPASNQIARVVNKGQQTLRGIGNTINSAVRQVIP